MTEQEAFEAWWKSEEYRAKYPDDHPVKHSGREGFDAALAWLRSQGEPVAWRYLTWNPFGHVSNENKWSLIHKPDQLQGSWSNSRDAHLTPLFLAPQPAIENDDREYLSAIAHLGSAMRRLVIAARTSGGTAGPDAELMAACAQAEDAMSVGAIGRAMAVPQPAIPDGWRLVPVSHTKEIAQVLEMFAADGYASYQDAWSDLIAAAPEPSK